MPAARPSDGSRRFTRSIRPTCWWWPTKCSCRIGRLRIRPFGSAGGHNGLKSIIEHVGEAFPRLRIGIGRGDPRWDLADHVLSTFGRDERDVIDRAIRRAADAVETFVAEGMAVTMNRFNMAGDKTADDQTG